MNFQILETVKIKAPYDNSHFLIINKADFNPDLHEVWATEQPKNIKIIETSETQNTEIADTEQTVTDSVEEQKTKKYPKKIIAMAEELQVDPSLLVMDKDKLIAICEKEFDVKLDARKGVPTMAQDITLLRQKYAKSLMENK